MPCAVLEQLRRDEKYHRGEFVYFYYPQNQHLHRESSGKAKKLAAEHQKKIKEISEKIDAHEKTCPECSRGTAAEFSR